MKGGYVVARLTQARLPPAGASPRDPMSAAETASPLDALAAPRRPTAELLALAAPIIGMLLTRVAMGFIDFVMVAQLGTACQAAISPATVLIFTITFVGLGLANAVQTFVSQAEGRGDFRSAGAYVWQAFYLAVVFGLLLAPLALLTPYWLGAYAAWANHPADVVPLEIAYVRIGLWSIAPAVVCFGLNAFFNGIHRPWVGMTAGIVTLVLNALGNWLLIFGHWGFPALGIAGAAWATLLGWCVRACVLLALFLSIDVDARYNTRRSLALSWSRLRGLLYVGAPMAIGGLIELSAWMLFISAILPRFGQAAMAASNAAYQYMQMAFMPGTGLGLALVSQVGFAIGAGQLALVELRVHTARRVVVGYMAVFAALFLLGGGLLLHVLNPDDPDPMMQAQGRVALTWVGALLVFQALLVTYRFALQGAGDTRFPSSVSALSSWLVFVTGAWLLARYVPQLGLHGPWGMAAVHVTLVGLLLWRRFASGAWRHVRLHAAAAPASAEALE